MSSKKIKRKSSAVAGVEKKLYAEKCGGRGERVPVSSVMGRRDEGRRHDQPLYVRHDETNREAGFMTHVKAVTKLLTLTATRQQLPKTIHQLRFHELYLSYIKNNLLYI